MFRNKYKRNYKMNITKTIKNRNDIENLAPCRIGFIGGSFNPIHNGHIALIEHALDVFFDYVIICPHSHNPNKKDILIPIEHRIRMISITAGVSRYSDKILIADPSFINGTHYEHFVDICLYLNSLDIYTGIICGSDSLMRPYFPGLLQFDHFIGTRIMDYSTEYIKSIVKGKSIFFETPFNALSSTCIRTLISKNQDLDIPNDVKDYISENSLYLTKIQPIFS